MADDIAARLRDRLDGRPFSLDHHLLAEALREIEQVRRERDLLCASMLVWDEARGWHIGNPRCQGHNQAQRLYAVREYLRLHSAG